MQSIENDPTISVNGWNYDPSEQAWTAKVGPSRWLIVRSDINDAPSFTPEQAS